MPSTRTLFVTSELYPLIKTGGLADVSGALPTALGALGTDIQVLLPGYASVLDVPLGWRVVVAGMRLVPAVWHMAGVLEGQMPTADGKQITIYAIDCPPLYRRAGGPYQDANGVDWADNAARFALLGAVAAYLAAPASPLAWQPHILHLNDWQSGLTAAYQHFMPEVTAKIVATIRNLSFAGDFPATDITQWGLPASAQNIHGIEYYGRASFLKAALFYADHITTVSPSYAREIQSAPLGCGFEGLLASRRDSLTGIVNGIDTKAWDPANDAALAAPYTRADPSGKALNKDALQARFGLRRRARAPLLGMVTRLTWQKGADSALGQARGWLDDGAQLVVLGSGDPGIELALAELARNYPQDMGFIVGYDEPLAHLLEAGADAFLMPSRFEPCGLNQMYGMRYGTPPIVPATGGLADTVTHAQHVTIEDGSATGFVFDADTSQALDTAVRQAITLYAQPKQWQTLMTNAMQRDFSWVAPARAYQQFYARLRQQIPGEAAITSSAHSAARVRPQVNGKRTA